MVRKATLEDLEAISHLNLQLFKYERSFTDVYSLDWTFSEVGQEYFRKRITEANGIVYVYQDQGKIRGYICGYTYTYPARKEPHLAEIDNMYVEENHRSKGVGAQLINLFAEVAKQRGVKAVRVRALNSNLRAHTFYKRAGFFEHGIVFEKAI